MSGNHAFTRRDALRAASLGFGNLALTGLMNAANGPPTVSP